VSKLEQHRGYLPYYPEQWQGIGGQHSIVPGADVVAMEMNDQQRLDAAHHVPGSG